MPDAEQFSIRTTASRNYKHLAPNQVGLLHIFIIIAVMAVILSAWKAEHNKNASYRALDKLGATVSFESTGPHYMQTSWSCVDLSGVRLTPDHFAQLQRCDARLSIDLTNTQIDDNAGDALIALQQMRHIEFAGSTITAEALRKIRAARPDVTIGQEESPFNLVW